MLYIAMIVGCTFADSIEIDASDQLTGARPIAVATSVSPTLAALDMPIYPKSAWEPNTWGSGNPRGITRPPATP